MLQALGARPQGVGRRLVDSRQRVAPHRAVYLPVAQLGPLDLAVGVVRLEGGGQGGGGVMGRGGIARGCLRGGGVGEVRRHEVPHLVTCSVVVGAVLRPVVVGARVRLGRRVSGVSVLLFLWVHCGAHKKGVRIQTGNASVKHTYNILQPRSIEKNMLSFNQMVLKICRNGFLGLLQVQINKLGSKNKYKMVV